MEPADDEPVARIPRSRGIKLDTRQLIRIAFMAALLAMVIFTARPCANAVSGFVTAIGGSADSASKAMPKPGSDSADNAHERPEPEYEQIRPDMTEDEVRAVVERAKAKAKARGAGSGSGSGASSRDAAR